MLRRRTSLFGRSALLVAVVLALVGCGGSESTSKGPMIDTASGAPKVGINRASHDSGGSKAKAGAKAD